MKGSKEKNRQIQEKILHAMIKGKLAHFENLFQLQKIYRYYRQQSPKWCADLSEEQRFDDFFLSIMIEETKSSTQGCTEAVQNKVIKDNKQIFYSIKDVEAISSAIKENNVAEIKNIYQSLKGKKSQSEQFYFLVEKFFMKEEGKEQKKLFIHPETKQPIDNKELFDALLECYLLSLSDEKNQGPHWNYQFVRAESPTASQQDERRILVKKVNKNEATNEELIIGTYGYLIGKEKKLPKSYQAASKKCKNKTHDTIIKEIVKNNNNVESKNTKLLIPSAQPVNKKWERYLKEYEAYSKHDSDAKKQTRHQTFNEFGLALARELYPEHENARQTCIQNINNILKEAFTRAEEDSSYRTDKNSSRKSAMIFYKSKNDKIHRTKFWRHQLYSEVIRTLGSEIGKESNPPLEETVPNEYWRTTIKKECLTQEHSVKNRS